MSSNLLMQVPITTTKGAKFAPPLSPPLSPDSNIFKNTESSSPSSSSSSSSLTNIKNEVEHVEIPSNKPKPKNKYRMRLCDAPPELLEMIKRSEMKNEKSLPEKSITSNTVVKTVSTSTITNNSSFHKIITSDEKRHRFRKNPYPKKAPSKSSPGITLQVDVYTTLKEDPKALLRRSDSSTTSSISSSNSFLSSFNDSSSGTESSPPQSPQRSSSSSKKQITKTKTKTKRTKPIISERKRKGNSLARVMADRGADALEKILKENGDRIAGFLFEPIQGEAGVVIPPDGYLKAVRDLCSKYNVLMIADEVQSGLARTGKMLACDWEEVRPDMVVLGKALGGGVIPVSAVLADKDVMLCIRPGEHGSTFGGNPLASAVAIASLEVIKDERLAERSSQLGEELRHQLLKIQQQFPNYIKEVRGRGLFNAVVLNSKSLFPISAYDICLKLKERGILAKPTHDTIVRLTPPLSMSLDELQEGSKALHDVLEIDLPKMQRAKPEHVSPTSSNICDRCGRNSYGSPDKDI